MLVVNSNGLKFKVKHSSSFTLLRPAGRYFKAWTDH